MPSSAPAAPAFILFLSEPAAGKRRAVQVRGLPFTLGATPDCSVPLCAGGGSMVRVEEGPEGLRVVDLSGDCLHCDGLLAAELPLHHGSSFEVGDAGVRFLIGTKESLRPRRERRKPEPSSPAAAHLERLEALEVKVSELRRSLNRSRKSALSAG